MVLYKVVQIWLMPSHSINDWNIDEEIMKKLIYGPLKFQRTMCALSFFLSSELAITIMIFRRVFHTYLLLFLASEIVILWLSIFMFLKGNEMIGWYSYNEEIMIRNSWSKKKTKRCYLKDITDLIVEKKGIRIEFYDGTLLNLKFYQYGYLDDEELQSFVICILKNNPNLERQSHMTADLKALKCNIKSVIVSCKLSIIALCGIIISLFILILSNKGDGFLFAFSDFFG